MRTHDLCKPLTPPLKWAGGKRWLVSHLESLWTPFSRCRLVEPFCGGLAVALGLQPQRALLNDINPHPVNFYTWLQRGLVITGEMCNEQGFYYARRDEFNQLTRNQHAQSQRAAELFYYLNRTGYNGLCRFNKQGGFNVPFGRYKTINYRHDFTDYRFPLQSWQFTAQDFVSLHLKPTDFVYADPPYDVEFRQYAKQGFSWSDQERLADWLAQHTGPVVASNQATPRILELYSSLGFQIQILDAPRRISCTGDRANAKEMLAIKGFD
ncbi:MAG: Dam family site-specific DNA-(adenine-N6)-methyltransferase [Spirulina sp. SIO3F2]|nr:Dam family site-specific DNA-(adenine-N6)-methyltransferase [Spirulina sp. SIO3F2]